jgi:hypothetical protein
MDSFPDIVRVATGRLKPANLYLATVQKTGGTSKYCSSMRRISARFSGDSLAFGV